jgi:repressor LexA
MEGKMMTPKEYQILDFIRSFISKHRYSPTIAEIAKGIKAGSRGTVYRYLEQLASEGHLNINEGKQRNIELTQQGWCDAGRGFSLPLLGKIAAGKPIEAVLNREQVDFGDLLADDRYVLKICGDSMIEEGIHDGDLVICKHAERANNGDIVVALIDNAFATLKKFYRAEKDKVTLKPANAELQPVTYSSERVTIQGIMMGLLRFPS